jgi:hypothetical protein
MIKDIRNYIEGNVNMARDTWFDSLEPETKAQALLREKLCQECMDAGKCVMCGCSTPGMFYAPHKTCSKGRWGIMKDPEDWVEYRAKDDGELDEVAEEGKVYTHTTSDGSVIEGEVLEIIEHEDREECKIKIHYVYKQNNPKLRAGNIIRIVKIKK